MSLHPDIIDAMVAAGASAGMDPGAVLAMVQAACRAAWNVAQQATNPPPVAPVRRETPREIAEEMRGIAAAMARIDEPRAPSLSKDPLSLSIMTVDSGNYGDNPRPLPISFQPDQKTKAFVVKQVGEASAAAIVSSFLDYFWARPVERETAAGWNERLRRWAKREKGYQRGPPTLPLMRPVGGQSWERRRESG